MDIQPTVTDMQLMCEEFMHRSKFAKTEMCKDDPMVDNPAILLIGFVSDPSENESHEEALAFQNEYNTSKPYKVAVLPLMHRDDVVDCIEDVVKHLNPRPFSFVALCAEGYFREVKDDPKFFPENYAQGDMEKEYKENPFTDIREALVITAIDWECQHLYSCHLPYRYDDNGVPLYDEQVSAFTPLHGVDYLRQKMEDLEMGRIPTVLTSFVMFTHLAVEATKFTDKFGDAPKRKKDDE